MTDNPESGRDLAARKRAMALASRADRSELETQLSALWPDHGARELKPAETGLVMVRGRAGGDGAPFNLGEATMTRAVVELPGGERGYGHVLGRDGAHARAAAVLDAIWQRARDRDIVETRVLAPIAARLETLRREADRRTAATKVDFFTLARGEDDA
jgi:alpha-D-ribose 1-methylphosphonate 5-triphosphate synthase subunit PhnG